jgi:hypothetical protein
MNAKSEEPLLLITKSHSFNYLFMFRLIAGEAIQTICNRDSYFITLQSRFHA